MALNVKFKLNLAYQVALGRNTSKPCFYFNNHIFYFMKFLETYDKTAPGGRYSGSLVVVVSVLLV